MNSLKMITLHQALKNSYASRDKQKGAFKNQGYVFDGDLSNDNEQVYYNPSQKKLLYTVSGTHNLKDVGTDLWLLGGKLKDTNRYKEASRILEKAKKRYNPQETSITGHSLGGSISQYIANKNDKVFTLDKGATFGQKSRSNEKAYRTSGDLVSVLNANSKNMTTLKNPNKKIGFAPIDILNSHNVANIKQNKIFV